VKVLLDGSYLGLGHYLPSARTGIFRVVEALAAGLYRSPDCTLRLCAADSLLHLQQTLDYLAEDPRLREIAVPHGRRVRALYRMQNGLIERLPQAGAGLPRKIGRRLQALTMRALSPAVPLIEPECLRDLDIYHSPYSRIPDGVLQTRAKRVFTIYDAPHFEWLGAALTADAWAVCISEATRCELLSRRGFDPTRAFVAPLAASPELFFRCDAPEQTRRVREKYRIPDGPYFLSLNTIVPRKNMERVIRSFAALVEQQSIPDLSFVLAGARGFEWQQVYELARGSPAIRDRIVLAGYVDDGDLAPLYSGALAFVYPSLWEGFGLPPLEAMQCGTPVVTSNCSSMPEVVGDAALLVSPTDQEEISAALLQLYRNGALRQDLSERGLARAKLFTWDRFVADTLAAYRAALA
jgi:glycosyltransferase involved in cell wall biosynthesis